MPASTARWRTFSGAMSKAKIRERPADFRPFAICDPASPNPTKPMDSSVFIVRGIRGLFFLQFVHVADAQFRELCAQSVEIHTQFTGLQALACLLFFCKTFAGKPCHF